MMHKTVQQRGGHNLVAHEFRPGSQILVARDDD